MRSLRVAIDMASVLKTCHSSGKDSEFGVETTDDLGNKIFVNSAAYGETNFVAYLKKLLSDLDVVPSDLLCVFEGRYNKVPRQAIDAGYKGKRTPCKLRTQVFRELEDSVKSKLKMLGAICLSQDYAEADDTLGYLAMHTEDDLIVVSNDGDMAALEGINAYGSKIMPYIRGVFGLEPCACKNKYLTVYKALVGDTSDSIPGIRGFGEKAFTKFVTAYGEEALDELINCAELGSFKNLVDDSTEITPILAKILDNEHTFMRCYKLAKIHPEWVNTLNHPLNFESGAIKGSTGWRDFADFEGKQYLVTGDKFLGFVPWFKEHVAKSKFIALDIETSVPDQGLEWAETQKTRKGSVVVDVIGSELSGMSLTFGNNQQYTVYIPVDHADTNCVDQQSVAALVMALKLPIVIHKTAFEGPVLYNAWGEQFSNNGFSGFLPNWLDTKLEASYVDENERLGLKHQSSLRLGYKQTEYSEVTTLDGKQYRMRELTAKHVFSYACDDTICTSALHRLFELQMKLEHTWETYKKVEISASYAHAKSFVDGFKFDYVKLRDLSAEDKVAEREAQSVLDAYLLAKSWGCCEAPVVDSVTKGSMELVASIVTGEVFTTKLRKLEEIRDQLPEPLNTLFAERNFAEINRLIKGNFKPEPDFKATSYKQLQKLLYEVMGVPITLTNKATDKMREAGEYVGSAKTDTLAIEYAAKFCKENSLSQEYDVLQALKTLKMCATRNGLYYKPYPTFVHWKTRKIHSNHKQCSTATRRASSSKPNIQQLAKNEKVEGFTPRIREIILPHHRKAVVVSMDFSAQELRVITDYSQDPGMLSCYVGDNKKDMHSMTGEGIYASWLAAKGLPPVTYADFIRIVKDPADPEHKIVKSARTLGKKVNFTTEYGAMAKKVAETLLCTKDEAQTYINAKLAAFPVVVEWKDSVIRDLHELGYATTKLGARRHLVKFLSGNKWEVSSAERQAVNFKIQGSSAEMTKLAEGRIWDEKLHEKYDCQIIGPIHDEIVASVAIADLAAFLKDMHKCMIQPYADMTIPIESSIAFGKSFGPKHQIELGEMDASEKSLFASVGYDVLHPTWIAHKLEMALAA